ncbi:MAG: glycosyltransferase [Pseudomonadota bacterium]
MIPSISVIVSTRNRPEQVVTCVRHVLATPGIDFELIVVDQSPEAQCERARSAIGTDSRLRWVHSSTQGLSISRNLGLSLARAPLVAFTDDDCEVPVDWLASIQREFAANERADMLFGAVALPEEERGSGYAADFLPAARMEFSAGVLDIRNPWGIGANMAFRREVFDQVGGFDAVLGAGTAFYAGEETDLTIRAVARGFRGVLTPDVRVLHRGVRHGADASRLVRGYGIGLGATLAKHRRLRTRGASHLLAQALQHNSLRSLRRLLRGDRHPGFGWIAAFLLGAARSRHLDIDRERSLFISPE